jgi:hypothetical protein
MLMVAGPGSIGFGWQPAMMNVRAEIKAMIEKNSELAKVVDSEPRRVLSKLYIEGTPAGLKNHVSAIIGSFGIDAKGNSIVDRQIAVTLMVEDITPKK